MRLNLLVASLLIFAAQPALAAEFYLTLNTSTKKCHIDSEKPDGTTRVMVGTSTYPTREDAKAAKEAAPECQKPANN